VVPALIDGWRGLLWGGIVRIAIHNHTMFAVNSICHAFGSQPFQTEDESRNNRVIAALAFGEGWHNNHHAFPAAAYHGMGRHPDVTGMVIRALERTGLAWDVHRPSPAALARRRARPIVGIPAGITRSE
jgi:stearoyl-CoA desaturase (delta-9 desaturase)